MDGSRPRSSGGGEVRKRGGADAHEDERLTGFGRNASKIPGCAPCEKGGEVGTRRNPRCPGATAFRTDPSAADPARRTVLDSSMEATAYPGRGDEALVGGVPVPGLLCPPALVVPPERHTFASHLREPPPTRRRAPRGVPLTCTAPSWSVAAPRFPVLRSGTPTRPLPGSTPLPPTLLLRRLLPRSRQVLPEPRVLLRGLHAVW